LHTLLFYLSIVLQLIWLLVNSSTNHRRETEEQFMKSRTITEIYTQRKTLSCPNWDDWQKTASNGSPNPHQWDTTATDSGMVKVFSGDPTPKQPVSYEIDTCPACGLKGRIKKD
jgi:hypothetical protein